MSNPDFSSLRSQIVALRAVDEDSELCPEEEKHEKLRNCASVLQRKFDEIFSEYSSSLTSMPSESLDEFLLQLKKEEGEVDIESEKIEHEIEVLMEQYSEDYNKLESELENLSCSLEFIESQNFEKGNEDMVDVPCTEGARSNIMDSYTSKFKMLELSDRIEKNKTTLKTLQDLGSIIKSSEDAEAFEDDLTGLKIIEIEGNSIRLSLRTFIPDLESVLRQQDIDGLMEPLELNHELIIGTVEGTWELSSVEIFPNDVYIGDIVDAAKSYRQLYPTLSIVETRSSLEYFVRRVQDKIALSSLRRIIIKSANKSRHSFENLDRENTIVAHIVGGIDAFIKLPLGWPLLDSPLELISLKNTNQHAKEISLSFLCTIVEMANSLNPNLRQKLSSFTDSVEGILMQQMRKELNSDSVSAH